MDEVCLPNFHLRVLVLQSPTLLPAPHPDDDIATALPISSNTAFKLEE
jgi:hypothetical protein